MSIARRTLLRSAVLGAGLGLTGLTAGCGLAALRGPMSTVGRVKFGNKLAVPALAESVARDGARTVELRLMAGESAIVPAGPTPTWGINGPLLGPTVRVKRGDLVRLNVSNDLPEDTSLHWHGMRLPAAADGGPHQMIARGATWSPSWRVANDAATLWYHPHPHGQTERHLYRGLAGVIIVDDEAEAALALPRTYGVDDVPLIVQDRTFDDEGALVETGRVDAGMLGDTVLVNGTYGPVLDVTAELTRLRIVNASAARTYNFGFSDDRTFHQIASDGGLLVAPVALSRTMLSPGERAEVVVAMRPGEQVTLRSTPMDLGLTQRLSDRNGANDELDILLLSAAATLRASPALPQSLVTIESLPEASAAQMRTFTLGDNRINGLVMDMNRIDARVAADTIEVWRVQNIHTRPHNFHIHDVQFRVLDVNGSAPSPEQAGWKDTVYVAPGTTVDLAMRFTKDTAPAAAGHDAAAGQDHAAHAGDAGMQMGHLTEPPYMFHCHLLWHEDEGMMGQFVVG